MTEPDTPAPGLRAQVLSGGAALVVRQVMSILLGIVGLIVITRIIGPASYGYYAGSLAVILVLNEVASFGMKVYLVRIPTDSPTHPFRQAQSLLAISVTLVVAVGVAIVFLLGGDVLDPHDRSVFLVMLATVPITVLGIPAFAVLERDLDFRTVAFIEFANDIVFYAVTVPLAIAGADLWAPVAGYLMMQAHFLVRATWASKLSIRPVSPAPLARSMLKFGLGYSAGQWLLYARRLVNPIVVGAFLGSASVGVVAVAIRAADTLTFIAQATSRLSVAAFARISNDVERLTASVEEGSILQLCGAGPLLALFAATAPFVTPIAFGSGWSNISKVFPYIGVVYLTSAISNMPMAVLYVEGKNGIVAQFQLIRIVLFVGAAVVLIPLVGITGYGLAEAVALLGFVFLHYRMRPVLALTYRRVGPLWLAWVAAIISPLILSPWGYALWLLPIAVMLRKAERTALRTYVAEARGLRGLGNPG